MNPPTPQSVVMRILSNALFGVSSEVGRVRWALHGHISDEVRGHLDRIGADLHALALGAENEAGRLEYQATLEPKDEPGDAQGVTK